MEKNISMTCTSSTWKLWLGKDLIAQAQHQLPVKGTLQYSLETIQLFMEDSNLEKTSSKHVDLIKDLQLTEAT